MGANPKRFRDMTPTQRANYRRNVIRLHRSLLLVHVIGLSCVFWLFIGLLVYNLVAK